MAPYLVEVFLELLNIAENVCPFWLTYSSLIKHARKQSYFNSPNAASDLDRSAGSGHAPLGLIRGIESASDIKPELSAPNPSKVQFNSTYRVGLSFLWLLKSATNSQMSIGFEFAITASKTTFCVCSLKVRYRTTPSRHTHRILFLNHLLCIMPGNNRSHVNTALSQPCRSWALSTDEIKVLVRNNSKTCRSHVLVAFISTYCRHKQRRVTTYLYLYDSANKLKSFKF